jgi:hypothetical protein
MSLFDIFELEVSDSSKKLVEDFLPADLISILNPVYILKLQQHVRHTGVFAFICARCGKRIRNQNKLVLLNGAFYGFKCHAKISARQLEILKSKGFLSEEEKVAVTK